MQSAYQIQAAHSPEALNAGELLWDSGRVKRDQCMHVEYGGPALKSEQRIGWRVRVWDTQEQCSGWSEISYWQMGLLNSSDWKANWIEPGYDEGASGPYPVAYLRKGFELALDQRSGNIRHATLHVSAHGVYEVYLNGEKVSEDLLAPGWTSYHRRLQYQSYDVTHFLFPGDNCIGAMLGDGWYRGPFTWQVKPHLYGDKTAFLCQLHVEYSDGSQQWILSDASWRTNKGAILKSEIYDGEDYDARLEQTGWMLPNFDDSGWFHSREREYGVCQLTACCSEPIRVTERISAKSKLLTPQGDTVLDFGQNLVGRIAFTLKGEAGARIVIDHAEVLDAQGNFYTENLRQAKQRVSYCFAGKGVEETYRPHFTFMGFRYIRIREFQGEMDPSAFVAEVFHTDLKMTGVFKCSDPHLNRLVENISWSLRGNFVDVPTDCPQRDERLGWTGDAQVFAPTACFLTNAAPFFTKWLKDIAAEQREDGSVPWVVPNVVEKGGGTGWSDGFGSTAWADVAVTLPWELYLKFGDTRVLREQYRSMKAWVEYMVFHAGERHIFDTGFHFGDWLSFAEYMSYHYAAPDYGYAGAHTEKDLIATVYFYRCTHILAEVANLLGFSEDALKYRELLPKIQDAFLREFVTGNGRMVSDTQTAYALSIAYDILPTEVRQTASQRLAKDIRRLGHLTTGFVGTPVLNHALTQVGCEEEAFQLLFNDRYPSWLYPVKQGATTIWERWDGIKPDGSFQHVGMNSFNHYAYGSVGDWLFSHVAGLQVDPAQPGYRKFWIKPLLTPKLDWVHLQYESLYGEISIRWELLESKLNLQVTVPPNTRATVFMPRKANNNSNNPTGVCNETHIYSLPVDYTIHEVGSGCHEFKSEVR